jgi:hypothetical protein
MRHLLPEQIKVGQSATAAFNARVDAWSDNGLPSPNWKDGLLDGYRGNGLSVAMLATMPLVRV